MNEFERDLQEPKIVEEDVIEQIRAKVREARHLQMRIDDCTIEAIEAEENYKKIVNDELPAIMGDSGIGGITIDNIPVELVEYPVAHLPKEDKVRHRRALDWLRDHGLGGIIKYQMTITLPIGDGLMEHKIREALSGLVAQAAITVDESIHAATYSATMRRLVDDSDESLPLDTLGIYIVRQAQVSATKPLRSPKKRAKT